MAPPNFPQGMTLHSIGFAALKFPSYPEIMGMEVPLGNQVGLLQRIGDEKQDQMKAQIASQYLTALLEFQAGDDPVLNDPTTAQYWFSTALCLLNFLTTHPEVCIRIAEHEKILADIVDKLLDPDVEAKMRAAPRTAPGPIPPSTFEDDFGSVLQFVSTILLYQDRMTAPPSRLPELVPKVTTWKRTYRSNRVRTIASASDRLVMQIQGMDPVMLAGMRQMQASSLVCGFANCGKRNDLSACSTCKVQRYCGREHQKKDFKYHKHICNKGLVEPAAENGEAVD